MASILRVNTLTDASSNNSVTTSTIFNGTIKHWVNYDAVSQATHGSFNQSSLTDNALGDFTTTYSNNLSGSEDKCLTFGAWNTSDNAANIGAGLERGGLTCAQSGLEVSATSKVRYHCHYGATPSANGGLYDYEANYCASIGDLA